MSGSISCTAASAAAARPGENSYAPEIAMARKHRRERAALILRWRGGPMLLAHERDDAPVRRGRGGGRQALHPRWRMVVPAPAEHADGHGAGGEDLRSV